MDHFLGKELGRPGFSAEVEPVLRVRPGTGETIGFETDDAAYVQLDEYGDLAALTVPINPVTGPVYVEGAKPGDVLAVTIHDILLKDRGWSQSLPGAGALQDRMGAQLRSRRIPIDEAGVHLTERLTVAPQPMIGCIGTAPAVGTNSTIMPSYALGGNMDLTEAAPGSTVYLPVEVDGALLSIGDIHAIMAKGESSFVAIEAEGVAIVSLEIVYGLALRAPRVETADAWVFVGLGDPVQESVQRGYEDVFDFLTLANGWDAMDAYAAMSALVDSSLGGPTGSADPDPLHPLRAVGAVTLHRLPKWVLAAGAA